MSEYDFVYEPLAPDEIVYRKKSEELEDFILGIEYEDMMVIKAYIKKNPSKFSKHLKNHIGK